MGEARGSSAKEDLRVKIVDGMEDSEDENPPQLDKKRKEREEGRGDGNTEKKKNLDGRIRELEKQMRQVNITVGEGEHRMCATTALMHEVVDLSHRVGQLEHAMYESWELREGSLIAKEAAEWKDIWIKKCQELRGKGASTLGACKNFIFVGIVNAYLAGKGDTADRRKIRELIMERVKDDEGKAVCPNKVHKLDIMVAHAQVVVIKKTGKSFINLSVRPTHMELKETLYAMLDKEGSRQQDPPPLKPRAREMKKRLAELKQGRN